MGNWATVPWIALMDQRETKTTQHGVYVVYLFRADMSGVYLTLNQGVTKLKKSMKRSQAREELRRRAESIRPLVADLTESGFKLDNQIDLSARNTIGADYEYSTIAYKLYEATKVPDDSTLAADLDRVLDAYDKYLATRPSPTPSARRTWIFQSNPQYFDLEAAVRAVSKLTWLVKTHAAEIHPGDPVYLWESGPHAGIVARATVRSDPSELPEDEQSRPFVREASRFEKPELRVWLEIEQVLTERLTRASLLEHPELSGLSIIKGPQGTSFAVTTAEAKALAALTGAQSVSVESSFDRADAAAAVVEAIDATGFVFEPWQIATYLAALRSKPFVILAGVSGTGKSKLPALVARATGGASHLIPVRPDWTDSSDVLGYVDLRGRFRAGAFLEIVRQATAEPERHHVCIIDEMNLARVEQYFAEVLSQIEDRRPRAGGGFEGGRLVTQTLAEEDRLWSALRLPPNLAIVGTVNMDESTHGFSRKVLDRAFTLEVSDIDLREWRGMETTAPRTTTWPVGAWHPRGLQLGRLSDLTAAEDKLLVESIDVLETINGFLRQAQLQVGYRVRDEVCLFLLHAREIAQLFISRDGTPVRSLDVAVQTKILPRVVGGSAAIRRVLESLLGWSVEGRAFEDDDKVRGFVDEWKSAGRLASVDEAAFPRSAARLCLMWERLQTDGYTSFWL